MARYQVSPIVDEACDAIDGSKILLSTDSLDDAREAAEHAASAYGAGIFDTVLCRLDVGFGFGVPCPDLADFTS